LLRKVKKGIAKKKLAYYNKTCRNYPSMTNKFMGA